MNFEQQATSDRPRPWSRSADARQDHGPCSFLGFLLAMAAALLMVANAIPGSHSDTFVARAHDSGSVGTTGSSGPASRPGEASVPASGMAASALLALLASGFAGV